MRIASQRVCPQSCPASGPGVAQLFNLLYRRSVIGRACARTTRPGHPDDPQNAILRYSRLKTCATAGIHCGLMPGCNSGARFPMYWAEHGLANCAATRAGYAP